ncbi:IS605 OrfB family transposase [Glycomyces artemisiae]|uniref:IS605 OrfB family transposase n=1 Tax=Glycomyces artemisiae TaxID=1076443 RepID=A0A2T0UIE6_9ACTN|nr:IS605 OrfB family transposase [Glycomyces artemisiae]
MVTVSRDSAGRWFVSIRIEEVIPALPGRSEAIGVDAGLTSLLTFSTGEKISNPRHERTDRQRVKSRQRDLTRKQKGSKNYQKARLKLARAHARIADRRLDAMHKLTTRLVRENQVICVEDLNVRGMLGNRKLARAIADASWATFRRLLEYKCEWYGRELVAVDRFLPSSRTCAACGSTRASMPLGVRVFRCTDKACGNVEDRDVNAAMNILAAGLAVAACGGGVRPKRS